MRTKGTGMAADGKVRTISKTVATKPGCAPLKEAYQKSVASHAKTWTQVENDFLRAMESFDANLARGDADMGDLQNGKGDFFNDLLALILENCAGTSLFSRGSVPGLIFPKHHLDVTYPNEGVVEFMLEAKAVGTPKHPGSPKEDEIGRRGSADLDKRVKEIGFKTIDLKGEYSRTMAARGEEPRTMSGNLTTWLRSVKPRSYVFFAARATSENDHARILRFADLAGLVSDAVGVYCFAPVSSAQPTTYKRLRVPTNLELDRVLFGACQDLVALKSVQPVHPPTPSPAVLAEGDAGTSTRE